METERLMQAVLQSFLDADLRRAAGMITLLLLVFGVVLLLVEVLPRSEDKPTTTNAGTGPSRERYDATTQAADGRYTYKHSRSETVRPNASFAPDHADSTAQAVDGRYATVYKVHHCQMTPTSPPPMTTEFPPQRPDVSYGGDNFQVGGKGSGETGNLPMKATCYRGAGLNWPSRGAVCAPRKSRCSDSFASSLRKYPSVSPERSAEVIERLVNYSMPRVYRSPRYSPNHSPRRSPPREPISYRSPKTYEETYAANCKPRAPEDCPTRDRREDYRKQINAKQGDIRLIREVSRRLRKTLKSISSYSHTQTLTSAVGRNQEWCDTPIPETSETDHEQDSQDTRASNHPVDTTVQAVAQTSSLGVETKYPSIRTIAVPVSPSPSSRVHNLLDPVVTRSVQTFEMPRRSIDTITSTTELTKCNSVKLVVKKSKSINDFRLNRDFKSEILAWLDNTTDPKIKEIQDTVLRNLNYRLKGSSVTGAEKIKVKLGNCLKHRLGSKDPSNYEVNKKHGFNCNTQSQDEFYAEDSRFETDQDVFEDIIRDWLSDVSIKKRDIFQRPVKKAQIYNTFVNRLKHFVFEKSKHCREKLLREEILEILDEVPIEVNTSDKSVYLSRITDALAYRLEKTLHNQTNSFKFKERDGKTNTNLRNRTRDVVANAMVEIMKKQNAIDPNVIKQTIVDLVDILMRSVNTNNVLEEMASVLHNATKLSEKEAFEFAVQLTENCKDLNNKKYAMIGGAQPLTVFMVQNLSRNYITKTSGTNMSRHSIGSIVDKDIEANLNQYKTKLAEQINKWLSDLAVLRTNDTDFRQAVVLDLACDIVDRQKYLEFNKDKGSDIDELEHLKYQIFKWMKRYVGEDNREAIDHAAKLMELIRNIPVPIINRSQYHLCKSNIGLCCKDDRIEPCTSTDVSNNVYSSKSDSGICNREESRSALESTHIRVNNESSNKQDNLQKQTRHHDQKSRELNRWNLMLNLSSTSVHDNSDLKNSQHISNDTSREHNIHTTRNERNQSVRINTERYFSEDTPIPVRSRDNLFKSLCGVSCRDGNFEPDNLANKGNHVIDISKCNEPQNSSVLTNYMVHKLSINKKSDESRQKYKTSSPSGRKNTNTTPDADTSKRSSKYKRSSREKSRHKLNRDTNSDSKLHTENAMQNDEDVYENVSPVPGPSELRNPISTYSDKPASASAKLIANWRPPPVFSPPPPGQPLINQVHEDFQEYLKNWCQQIPIASNTPDEMKVAEKARQGILNGIWKKITMIKTQPAVFQNKFYYEDVLGKEIDELIDCLPQTEELQEKRYALKAQLLEKNSEMNELIRELEVPENYKELVAQKRNRMEDAFKKNKLRENVRIDFENPTKLFEEMLMYCTLDDFLGDTNYKETDKVLGQAYKIKLLETIKAYMDSLKKSYGKEIENLVDIYMESLKSDVYDALYKVTIPTEDTIKENENEILLGLEIEDWMNELPLVKNDDSEEQRHRRRLKDALTKKINEMEKRNISDCCGDTQVRHEISVFLDKVPLERGQDLQINEMVEELTNRLKRRHGAGGRRKSVAFQEGYQNQSNRLLNKSQLTNATAGSNRRHSTGSEWQGNDDAQYRNMFQNPPLCSTRIEQPGDEWAMEEDEDAQYRAVFCNKPACSSMIEPQGSYGPQNTPAPPDYPQPYNQDPYFVYAPGQFHESVRGGAFGYFQPSSPPPFDHRFQYRNLVTSRRGSPQSRYFEDEASLIPNASIRDSQFQPAHGFVSETDANQALPSMLRPAYNPTPPAAHFEDQNGAAGFVSMMDAGPHVPPQMQSGRFSSGRSPYNSHRSQIEPNISQRAPSIHTSGRIEQPFIEPAAGFLSMMDVGPPVPPQMQSGCSSCGRPPYHSHRSQIDSNISQGVASVHTSGRVEQPFIQPAACIPDASRYSTRPNNSHSRSQGSDMIQPNAGNEFVSIPSHQPPVNQSFGLHNQPSVRISPAPGPEFRRSTDREGIQEIINQNRSANRSAPDIQGSGPCRQPQSPQASRNKGEAAGGPTQSSPQRPPCRFLASNAPSSDISNQPAFYSTPDQEAPLAPPNMRERPQVERERTAARRLDMNTEDNEGDERCYCRERFKKWNRQEANCTTCDDCLQGSRGYFPYPYPYPYPLLPMARLPPPYPPNCRR